jgi:hypothetical protein
MSKKIYKKITLSAFAVVYSLKLFAQKGYYGEPDGFNWSTFNSERFYGAAVISAVIISIGLVVQKKYKTEFSKRLGNILVIIGGIGAFLFMGGAVLEAISIIWKVFIGVALFAGIIYWTQLKLIEKR